VYRAGDIGAIGAMGAMGAPFMPTAPGRTPMVPVLIRGLPGFNRDGEVGSGLEAGLWLTLRTDLMLFVGESCSGR
jgi:hypothetical protein